MIFYDKSSRRKPLHHRSTTYILQGEGVAIQSKWRSPTFVERYKSSPTSLTKYKWRKLPVKQMRKYKDNLLNLLRWITRRVLKIPSFHLEPSRQAKPFMLVGLDNFPLPRPWLIHQPEPAKEGKKPARTQQQGSSNILPHRDKKRLRDHSLQPTKSKDHKPEQPKSEYPYHVTPVHTAIYTKGDAIERFSPLWVLPTAKSSHMFV